MGEATEMLEHMEHASHAGHEAGHGGGKPIGKFIGLTMAVLGVMLALCSAMVGASRTELIATMVMQTNVSLDYQSVSTKHRMLNSQLQQLHALMPLDMTDFNKAETQLKAIEDAAKGKDYEPVIKVVRLEIGKVLNTVTPTHSDVLRFVELVRKFDSQREAAKEWAESFDAAIEAHAQGAEHFEWGQLCAEIGIVIASIGLLLTSRFAWYVSITFGVIAAVIIVVTFMTTRAAVHKGESHIEEAKAKFEKLVDPKVEKEGDEKLLEEIEHAPG